MGIARRWSLTFTEERDMQDLKYEMTKSYLDHFIQALIKVESPQGILDGFTKLYEHTLTVSRYLRGHDVHFDPVIHRKFFRRLDELDTRNVTVLEWMYKHLEVVEKLARLEHDVAPEQFGHKYYRYMALLANGAFKDPSDIDSYFDLYNQLPEERAAAHEADVFITNFLSDAKKQDTRALLVEFMTASPVLDSVLYTKWKKLKQEKRAQLIEEVTQFMHDYLYNPRDVRFKSKFGVDYAKLEDGVIVKLVRTSRATKEEIRKQLSAFKGKLALIPDWFSTMMINVKQRVDKEDYQLDNKDKGFLNNKVAAIRDIRENAEGNRYVAQCIDGLLRGLSGHYQELRANLAKQASENTRAGMMEQMKAPAAFITFIRLYNESKITDPILRRMMMEMAFAVLSYDKSFHKKHAELYAKLVLFSQWRDQDTVNLLQRPYKDIVNLTGKEPRYNLPVLNSLYQIFAVNSQDYFIRLFREMQGKLPATLKIAFETLLTEAGLNHLADANYTVRADFFYNIFKKYQGVKQIEDEAKALKKKLDKKQGVTRLEVALVPGKTRLDQFYGDIGENCTSGYPDEILRKDFIPVRIINTQTHTLEGYLHLLDLNYEGKKILMVPGIEPKQSFLSNIDEVDFYVALRKCLVEWAKKGNYSMVVYPLNSTAHSNRDSIKRLILGDIEDKPMQTLDKVWFPKEVYKMNGGIVIWSDGTSTFPIDTPRYSMQVAARDIFV